MVLINVKYVIFILIHNCLKLCHNFIFEYSCIFNGYCKCLHITIKFTTYYILMQNKKIYNKIFFWVCKKILNYFVGFK